MAEQLFQIGMKAIIRNAKGEVLLQAFEHSGVVEMWDMPGGRMDPGENFMQALKRELKEEIAIDYDGEPRHVLTMLSNVMIPFGDTRVPLVLIAYEIDLPEDAEPRAAEEYSVIRWVSPAEAAKRLSLKFPAEFCELLAKL